MLGLDLSVGGLPPSEYKRQGGQKINTQRIPRGEAPSIDFRTIEDIKNNRLGSLRNYYPSQPQFINTPQKQPIDKWQIAQQLGYAGYTLYNDYQSVYGEQEIEPRQVEDDEILQPRRAVERLADEDDGDDGVGLLPRARESEVLEIDEPWAESKHDRPIVRTDQDLLFRDPMRQVQADVSEGDLSYPFFVGIEDPLYPAMEAPPSEIME
jgi:hypothetical protein